MTRWKNWAGNQQAAPARVVAPRSVEEVVAVVTASAAAGVPGQGGRLRALLHRGGRDQRYARTARGHDEPPLRRRGDRARDGRARHAAARAVRGARPHGLALTNMGDINVQTVMGAISTSTHGTGRDSAGLSAFVRGLEIVLADGSVVTCGPGDDLFEAARVSVGSLGVVTAVTLQTEPSFLLRAREEPMRWEEVLDSFDAFCADNEHWEFYWFPHSEGCQVKRNNRSAGPAEPLSDARRWWDDEFLSNSVFGARQPARASGAAPRAVRQQGLGPRAVGPGVRHALLRRLRDAAAGAVLRDGVRRPAVSGRRGAA